MLLLLVGRLCYITACELIPGVFRYPLLWIICNTLPQRSLEHDTMVNQWSRNCEPCDTHSVALGTLDEHIVVHGHCCCCNGLPSVPCTSTVGRCHSTADGIA
jgi:hypothetical protein